MATSNSKGEVPGIDMKFECGICLKEFSSNWCLEMHAKTHDEKRSFDCHECGMNFPAYSELCDHLKQHIFGEDFGKETCNLVVCRVCGKEYPVSQMAVHKRSHVFKPGLTCTTCGKSFGSKQVLKLHLRTHGSETLYQCKICGLKFASRNSFVLHWNSHGAKESSPVKSLSKAKRNESRGKAGIHQLLSKKSQSKFDTGSQEMGKHQAVIDPPFMEFVLKKGNSYFCSVCKKVLKGKDRAERHAKYHFSKERSKSGPEIVKDDSQVGKSPGMQPVKRRRSNNSEKANQEEVVREIHSTTCHIGSEISTETSSSQSEDILDCSECSKTFSSVDDLQRHKKIHLQQYAQGLIRILGHSPNTDLSLEPGDLIGAVQSAAESAKKERKLQKEADPDEDHSVIATEGDASENNARQLLKDFSDLYKMMNVKVVLDRLDVSKFYLTCTREESDSNNTHSTDVSISPENRTSAVGNNVPQSVEMDLLNNKLVSKNESELTNAEFAVSGSITSCDFVDDQAYSSAIATGACENDSREDLSNSSQEADKALYSEKIKQEVRDYIFGPEKSANRSAKAHTTRHVFKCSVCSYESSSELCFQQHLETHGKIRDPEMLSQGNDTSESFCKIIAANTSTDSDSSLVMVIVPSNSEDESRDRKNGSKNHTSVAASDVQRSEETLELADKTPKGSKHYKSKKSHGILDEEFDVSDGTYDMEDTQRPQESTSRLKQVVSSRNTRKRIRDYISKCGSYFRCRLCKKKYKSKSQVYVHVKYHFKEKKHKCEHCGKTFKDRKAIAGHIMYHVRQNEKITGFSDEDFKAVKNHFVQNGDIFTCLICNYNHKSRLGAYNHVLNHLVFDKSRASESTTDNMKTFGKLDDCAKDESTMKCMDTLNTGPSSTCKEANRENTLAKDIAQSSAGENQINFETDSKERKERSEMLKMKTFQDVQITEANSVPSTRQEKRNMDTVPNYYGFKVPGTTFYADRSFEVDIADYCKSYGSVNDDNSYPESTDWEAHEEDDEELQRRSLSYDIYSQDRNRVAKEQTDVFISPTRSVDIDATSEDLNNISFEHKHHEKIDYDKDMKQEVAEEKYECVQCCKHFSRSSQFEFHKLIHQAVEAIGENLQDVPTKSRLSQVLTCPVCKKQYPTVFKLREHVRVHTDEKNIKCDVCGLAVKNQSQLLRHQNSHKPFKCELCPKKFYKKNVLKHHILEEHREDNEDATMVTCENSSSPLVEESPSTSSESDSIKAVFMEDENNQEFTQMKLKDENFSSVEQGKSHDNDESKTPCDSSSKPQYTDYVNKVDEMYGCTLCQKKFELKVKCHTHVQNHFFMRKKHACKVCDYSTISKLRLRMHMNEHQKKKAEFPCNICHRVFSVFSYLTSHLESHTDEEKIKHLNYVKCPKCGIACKSMRSFYRHKLEHLDTFQCQCCGVVLPSAVAFENHAYEMGHFYCEGCGKKYSSFATLQSHQRGCHDEMKSFQCDKCPQRFASARSLKLHLQSHEVKYTCKICRESFESHKELKDHKIEKNHEVTLGQYTCDICKQHFNKVNVFEVHKLVHQALEAIGETLEGVQTNGMLSQVITCPVCRKEYPTFAKFREHARLHTEEKKFRCDICGLEIRTLSYLKTHMNIHNNERPYLCDSCPRSFHSQTKLNEHIKRLHDKDVCRIVTCDICGKKLKKDSLKMHKLRHDQTEHVKKFPCDLCGKKFYTQQQLKSHKLTHTNQAVFMCDICGKFLNSKYTLQEHKKGHTGVKPFLCSVCGKGFKNKQFLKRHLTVHSGEKPHVCDICNKAFNQPETLKNHRNIHTGEKPYRCDFCGERFGDRWARHRHMKRHGDERNLNLEWFMS